MAAKVLSNEFPIHWLVWHNNYIDLDNYIKTNITDLNRSTIEQKDPRGRTPLYLAVTLGHLESTKILLKHGADANAERNYWSALQEATCTGDPEIVQLILQYRDYQRVTNRSQGIPDLLQRLKEAPDFYVEMKWEFTSWVPLVSRMCPSDTYKVFKSGANVRIDTTLLGFDNTSWKRGRRTFIFRGQANETVIEEIDHDAKCVYTERMTVLPTPENPSLLRPSCDQVAIRLTSPVNTTFIDTDKIAFERNKSGIWGWRSDKVETINGYECKVFNASNVELVTKTRTEHLTEQDKAEAKKSSGTKKSPLQSLLGISEEESKVNDAINGEVTSSITNPCHIKPEEYFNNHIELEGKDIGRPKEQLTKVQKFKATLSLCEEYPLSLQQQVLPIIDLMAQTNAHFQKLKDFITLQLPAGFPVKIEIPLFMVLNAKITFGNIYAVDKEVAGITCLRGEDNMMCIVDDINFEVPAGYREIGIGAVETRHPRRRDEDDELLQFAIQQSLIEAGTENDQVTILEALHKTKPSSENTGKPNISRPLPSVYEWQEEEDPQLQRILELSLMSQSYDSEAIFPEDNEESIPQPIQRITDDDQVRLALEISQREQSEADRRQQEDEEELQRILELSLTEK